ncbi:hypothetical protein ACHHYP_12340 [Achlya hypogyna]|uniref:N-acetyltransferase domain-containing protein n=1 Tax=Achlya hypogyna TaxID=1202772 RepID=A0A1V9ZH74_ACHHY|nr:hypothetical protein ACHHYP_12340 [Achlya hypogyna]
MVEFRGVASDDIAAAHALEAASFPTDEAATLAQLEQRLADAGTYFLGAYVDGALVGFVNGTLSPERAVTTEALLAHDPDGSFLCIHSVVVAASHRRQGLASQMLRAYIARVVDAQPHVQALLLVAKPALVQLYVAVGFRVTRLSPVVHGRDAWLELVFDTATARRVGVVQVDAFARRPFEGNPAAVVVLTPQQFDAPGAAHWMQLVALERNLSETAFVTPIAAADFRLRWFKPAKEVDICGHATLAAAHALYEDGHCAESSPIRFHTRSGVLTTRRVLLADGSRGIEMDFPTSHHLTRDDAWRRATTAALLQAFMLAPSDLVAVEQYGTDVICHVAPAAFATVTTPNFTHLLPLECRATILTCEAPQNSGYDFYSRFFGPRSGVNEDPVTGSAHCALAPYWSHVGGGRQLSFCGRQRSARGGDVDVRLAGDRVFIVGTALFTLRGTLIH